MNYNGNPHRCHRDGVAGAEDLEVLNAYRERLLDEIDAEEEDDS